MEPSGVVYLIGDVTAFFAGLPSCLDYNSFNLIETNFIAGSVVE